MKIIEKSYIVLLPALWLLSCSKRFENSMISAWVRALKKNWPGEELFKLINLKFWVRHFLSIVTFKYIFDILVCNNLFISFSNLFIYLLELKNIHEKHTFKEHMCKFKIDKITYWKLQSRTKYYVTENKPSMYP